MCTDEANKALNLTRQKAPGRLARCYTKIID